MTLKAKSLLMAAMTVMAIGVATTGYAASHSANVATAAAQMDAWREMALAGDLITPVIENDKFYIHNDMKIAYYDEWVVHEAKEANAFRQMNVFSVGLPQEWADEMGKGGGDEE